MRRDEITDVRAFVVEGAGGDTFTWDGSMTLSLSGTDVTAPLHMTGTRTSTNTTGCPGGSAAFRVPWLLLVEGRSSR